MRRVVVTGIGMVSCIGHEAATVTHALRTGRSGVSHRPEFAQAGMASQVAGVPDIARLPLPPRKLRRFMSDAALYGWQAARQALDDAALPAHRLSHPRTGLIVGSGVGSTALVVEAHALHADKGMAKVPPYTVPQVMGSTVSANLAAAFAIQGVSYGLTSACATSAHCLGHACELIQFGKQDVMIAGGAEEVGWHSAMLFDAMGVLAPGGNDHPAHASRPYDRSRNGFVIAGGAGVLVLEELEHALARGAPIYAELAGYGATCDGDSMVNPSGDGALRAMRLALGERPRHEVDYVNTHATGTERGDLVEVEALCRLFDGTPPAFSSTKALTGHAIGAAGALEAAFSLLMLRHGFIAPSANIATPDPALAGLPLVTALCERPLSSVLCNSFGFGGTNASLLFSTRHL
ncbi:beta-ketoacyl synthase N-terminal-like domain-containing protein [Pseudogulbenkiania sp. MAI-1]|uniref:beta-ketoacyl synthase N-terminal-like domain-containing protein n=1 Tax=Pseudogulbenkiania sp. MAI-1 TaxID=990370 RepID=UPI00045E7B41|nr:beta-ketoacyl synthase N-terminal-like domain-containing protein [Pseudogulbenkiania sp. MAI-1]